MDRLTWGWLFQYIRQRLRDEPTFADATVMVCTANGEFIPADELLTATEDDVIAEDTAYLQLGELPE